MSEAQPAPETVVVKKNSWQEIGDKLHRLLPADRNVNGNSENPSEETLKGIGELVDEVGEQLVKSGFNNLERRSDFGDLNSLLNEIKKVPGGSLFSDRLKLLSWFSGEVGAQIVLHKNEDEETNRITAGETNLSPRIKDLVYASGERQKKTKSKITDLVNEGKPVIETVFDTQKSAEEKKKAMDSWLVLQSGQPQLSRLD